MTSYFSSFFLFSSYFLQFDQNRLISMLFICSFVCILRTCSIYYPPSDHTKLGRRTTMNRYDIDKNKKKVRIFDVLS